MPGTSSNTKRIARNTIILYVRMIAVMLITLYTSRLILQALGVDDFGLFNVVGGVVGLLTFFQGTMNKSTQRFLNISMVKGDDALSSIFASSITVHLIIVVAFLVLGETVGLWFLNAKINIPEGRELAANIVYQASLFSFCLSIITTPYSAAVIAYERMTFLAVVSIIDAVIRLGIAIFLLRSPGDRLILYGVLVMCTQLLNFFLYFHYCRRKYCILKFRLSFEKENIKQIFSFVSWTLVGQFAVVGCNQGNVVLVNMFHSLAANAAMSVGNEVNKAITNLTTNFQTAFNPQITKSFAEGNYVYLSKLVNTTSKMSFCIMFVVALPLAFNIDWVLDIWLDTVPTFSNAFAILFIVNGIVNAISMPYNYTVLSSGNIRNLQLVTAAVFLLDIPIAYVLFILGMPPVAVLWVKIGVIVTMLFVRVFFASRVVRDLRVVKVCKDVLLPISITATIPIALIFLLNSVTQAVNVKLLLTIPVEIVCLLLVWFVCFSKDERLTIINMIKKVKNQRYVKQV